MLLSLYANLSFYIPEIMVVLTMVGLLFIEAAYKPEEKERTLIFIASAIGLVLSLVALVCNMSELPTMLFSEAVIIDPFSTVMKMLMVLGALGVIYLAKISNDIYTELKSEFVIMTVGVVVGGMLLASANNLLTLYLGIETLSILSYVLSSFKKNDARSTEAGMKYALYGGISAGVMLFGMSHIYGMLGTIQFQDIATKVATLDVGQNIILMTSFIFFFAGVGYKIACFPFHMWSPDVYQGSPIPVTSFFSIVPKMAGMAALLRVSMTFFGGAGALQSTWIGLLHVVAALTMTVGNVSAIGQDSVKRMLAFSSIGHAGMMLLGVTVMNDVGVKAIVFYGITYLFMTLAAFYVVSAVSDMVGSDSQSGFKGLIYKHPLMAILMSAVLFSLAGLPPFSGFVAKFNIFNVVVEKKYYGLALIAAINSVIGLYYYMKIVKLMIFDKAEFQGKISGFTFVNQLAVLGITVPVVVLGIFWEKAMVISAAAKLFIK